MIRDIRAFLHRFGDEYLDCCRVVSKEFGLEELEDQVHVGNPGYGRSPYVRAWIVCKRPKDLKKFKSGLLQSGFALEIPRKNRLRRGNITVKIVGEEVLISHEDVDLTDEQFSEITNYLHDDGSRLSQ